ncbi:glucosamine-6-phosphate deaminase [Treponema parvum]|uniref:Glucosamine-6-phosphate deaminase n=1 Tax=Treponema parvum TaxID=138851 RepID=A0A975IE14_9SPIR|nr:glucosamine-6-phosphate deaminase [Treponema parvum]QTQ13575.1 glucosamine-6-phosphate deaminase [Treponema parvum]
MRLIIKKNYDECSSWAADHIAHVIKTFNPSESKPFVIGLPTGSTPIGTYENLIKKCKAGEISFKDVVSFNMDEYEGLPPDNDQSYRYFMDHTFFNHVDIKKPNTHVLNGCASDLSKECGDYEKAIEKAGGIRLFMGGVGNDGHIAFNEPGTSLSSRTHVQLLTEDTRIVNSRFFGGDVSRVPERALTVGIGTICDADELLFLVTGRAKAYALAHAVEDSVSQMWPITALQLHKNAIIVCDEDAVGELKVNTVKYFKEMEKDSKF